MIHDDANSRKRILARVAEVGAAYVATAPIVRAKPAKTGLASWIRDMYPMIGGWREAGLTWEKIATILAESRVPLNGGVLSGLSVQREYRRERDRREKRGGVRTGAIKAAPSGKGGAVANGEKAPLPVRKEGGTQTAGKVVVPRMPTSFELAAKASEVGNRAPDTEVAVGQERRPWTYKDDTIYWGERERQAAGLMAKDQLKGPPPNWDGVARPIVPYGARKFDTDIATEINEGSA